MPSTGCAAVLSVMIGETWRERIITARNLSVGKEKPMKAVYGYALLLAVIITTGCAFLSQATTTANQVAPAATVQAGSPANTPPAEATETAVPTGPTADACATEALRAYLRQFVAPMTAYEFGLIQVYGITNASNGTATLDKYNTAMGMIQSAHDSIAALPAPYCAQKMQSDMLSSMEHMTAAIKVRVSGGSETQFQAEMTQAKTYQKSAEDEFGVLTAKAGLNAPAPTP